MKDLKKVLVLLESGRGRKLLLDSIKTKNLIYYLNNSENWQKFMMYIGFKSALKVNRVTKESYIEKIKDRIKNEPDKKSKNELKKALKVFELNCQKNQKTNFFDSEEVRRKALLREVLEKAKNGFYKGKRFYNVLRDLKIYKRTDNESSNAILSRKDALEFFNNSPKVSYDEKEAFEKIVSCFDDNNNQRASYKSFLKPQKIQTLNNALKKIEEENLVLYDNDICRLLHFHYPKDMKAYFDSDEADNDEKELFKQIRESAKKGYKPEEEFYKALQELIGPESNYPYKNKITIEPQGRSDTEDKSPSGKQSLDFIIKFNNGPINFEDRKISGIGIECNGEVYHTYENFVVHKRKNGEETNYLDKLKSDLKRHESKENHIRYWDEKDKSDKSISLEEKAKDFIKKEIIDVLNSIFNGNRAIKNSKNVINTALNQKRGEIYTALTDKINKNRDAEFEKERPDSNNNESAIKMEPFTFVDDEGKSIKILDIGYYFLINKHLCFDKQSDGSWKPSNEKLDVWGKPVINKKYIPPKKWKDEVREAIIKNEKYLKEHNIKKGTIEWVNKACLKKIKNKKQKESIQKSRPILRAFNVKRNDNRKIKPWLESNAAKQFAKLFEEIKKKNL